MIFTKRRRRTNSVQLPPNATRRQCFAALEAMLDPDELALLHAEMTHGRAHSIQDATVTEKEFLSANNPQTLVSGANLNNLTSGSSVLGSAFSNVQADSAGDGLAISRLKLHIDSMAVSSGGIADGWFLTASDGTLYEQGDATHIPLKAVDFIFQPIVQTAAVDIEILALIPICATIKCLFRNNALGAATPSNNNGYMKAYYQTSQYL